MSEHRDRPGSTDSAQNRTHGRRTHPQTHAGVERESHHLALGMSIGIAMGIGFGALFDQIAIGMGVGLSIGMAIGALIDARARK